MVHHKMLVHVQERGISEEAYLCASRKLLQLPATLWSKVELDTKLPAH